MKGFFITFEGTEGAGKSTHIQRLAGFLGSAGFKVRTLREPGGTAIGEEIRHTLKHSTQNQAMTPEAELLLMNASRAQLVREIIQPALAAGEVVLCDRFLDSTIAYQGYGRQMDLKTVNAVIDIAVGSTRPNLTFLLTVPLAVSELRRVSRRAEVSSGRDRFEESDRDFFERVEAGYKAIAAAEPGRVCVLDSTRDPSEVEAEIRSRVSGLIGLA
jgi:dTMP kinase